MWLPAIGTAAVCGWRGSPTSDSPPGIVCCYRVVYVGVAPLGRFAIFGLHRVEGEGLGLSKLYSFLLPLELKLGTWFETLLRSGAR